MLFGWPVLSFSPACSVGLLGGDLVVVVAAQGAEGGEVVVVGAGHVVDVGCQLTASSGVSVQPGALVSVSREDLLAEGLPVAREWVCAPCHRGYVTDTDKLRACRFSRKDRFMG
jgi:hypothetical protein